MKELFGGFYNDSEDESKDLWNNEKTVFIFDTNALLLLYRCEKETRDAFFIQWEKIRGRVWLPFHVCLEYQRNRLTAIKDHVMELKNSGAHIAEKVSTSLDKLDEKHNKTISRYESLRAKLDDLKSHLKITVDSFVNEQIESRIREADFLSNHDTVRDRISELVGSRIGTPPDQQRIDELESEGAERYKKLIPPGFEDEKLKKEESFNFNGVTYKRKFGDWFIWSDILEFAEENQSSAVVYVTNDLKDDWWFEVGGRKRGAQESLKTELAVRGGGTSFLLYSSASFLNAANSYLEGSSTSVEVIKEIERVSEEQSKTIIDYEKLNELLNLWSKTETSEINKKWNSLLLDKKKINWDSADYIESGEYNKFRGINLSSATIHELNLSLKLATSSIEELRTLINSKKNNPILTKGVGKKLDEWLQWAFEIECELHSRNKD